MFTAVIPPKADDISINITAYKKFMLTVADMERVSTIKSKQRGIPDSKPYKSPLIFTLLTAMNPVTKPDKPAQIKDRVVMKPPFRSLLNIKAEAEKNRIIINTHPINDETITFKIADGTEFLLSLIMAFDIKNPPQTVIINSMRRDKYL